MRCAVVALALLVACKGKEAKPATVAQDAGAVAARVRQVMYDFPDEIENCE